MKQIFGAIIGAKVRKMSFGADVCIGCRGLVDDQARLDNRRL